MHINLDITGKLSFYFNMNLFKVEDEYSMFQNNHNDYAKQHKWGLTDAHKWDKTVKLSISLIWVSPKSRFNILCFKTIILIMLNNINID